MTAAAAWLRVSAGHQDSGSQVPGVERFTARHSYDVAGTCTVSESAWNGVYRSKMSRLV